MNPVVERRARDQRAQNQEVLTPTEARQASPRLENFRVLLWSMAIIVALGSAMLAAFWLSTPRGVEGVPDAPQTQPAPSTQPGR